MGMKLVFSRELEDGIGAHQDCLSRLTVVQMCQHTVMQENNKHNGQASEEDVHLSDIVGLVLLRIIQDIYFTNPVTCNVVLIPNNG